MKTVDLLRHRLFGLALVLATGGGWSCSPASTDAATGTSSSGWPIGDCQDEITGTGFDEGETDPDFALLGQHGENIRLHSFCDRVVLLLGSAFL